MSDSTSNIIGDAADAGTGTPSAVADTNVTAPVEGGDKSIVAGAEGTKDAPGATKPETVAAAPEKYAEFKMPEGVEFDKELQGRAEPLFKELGLSQEQAEKTARFLAAEDAAKAVKAEEGYKAYLDSLVAAAKADQEIGGDKLNEVASQAKQFVQKFGRGEKGAEVLKVLDDTGMGSHPAIISLFAKAWKAMSEDSPSSGEPNNMVVQSTESKLYPTMNPK